MKIKEVKSFITGMITMLLIILLVSTVFAAPVNKTLTATYRDIIITVNGEQIEPKDENGNIVEPFIVGGTTYLPVRAVAGAVGYDVDWDGESSTVMLNKKILVVLNTSSKVYHLSEFCIAVGNMHEANREDITVNISEIPEVTEEYEPCRICAG